MARARPITLRPASGRRRRSRKPRTIATSTSPQTYSMYIAGLVFKWLKALGGMPEIEKRNIAKSKLLYDFLDTTKFYGNPVAKEDRSRMNVPFTLRDAKLDEEFLKGATKEG